MVKKTYLVQKAVNKWSLRLRAGYIISLLFWGLVPVFSQDISALQKSLVPDLRTGVFEHTFRNDTLFLKTDQKVSLEKVQPYFKGPLILSILPESSDSLALVNVSVANLKSEPRHSSELSSQLLLGMPLRVLEKTGSWYRVQGPDQYIGYMEEAHLAFVNHIPEQFVVVQKPLAFVKDLSNKTVISDVTYGNVLALNGKKGSYFAVTFPDGRKGLLSKKDAVLGEKVFTQKATDLVETAKSMSGIPYLWGGTSWRGVDCSGFTRTAYLSQGILLPRDASQQAVLGEKLEINTNYENILPGDLLFFGKGKVTHVALSLGGGTFIHSSGMVCINSLDPNDPLYDAFNAGRLLFIKRIKNDSNLVFLNSSTFYPR